MTRHSMIVSSFYRFFPLEIDEISVRKLSLEARAAKHDLTGLVILAPEGCNGTIAGDADSVLAFEQALGALFGDGDWMIKRAYAIHPPFRDFRVKVRSEIVTTRTEGLPPVAGSRNHLSPEEWQRKLDSGEDFVLLDTRNRYETQLGTFHGAIDPQIHHFSEFGHRIQELGIDRNKQVLIYCTGGIRCEKAILEMERQGYQKVAQLEGGILRYLEHFPHRSFAGECFVFDGRVAVDQNLQPTRTWHFCPHCGDPAKDELRCAFCDTTCWVCEPCSASPERNTCSSDCAYKLVNDHPRRVANG